MLEGLGRGGADRGLLFAIGAHLFGCLVPLSIHARQSPTARWEESLRDGNVIGALAVTEAAGGSSLEHIETTLVETEGGYVLSGRKTLIGNAPEAGVFLVVARQFPDRGPLGLTALLVPRDINGLTVTPIATAGLPSLPMGDVVFDQCLVLGGTVLGGPGMGLRVFATAMLWERSCLLAGFLGAAERDLEACLSVLRERGGHQGSLLRHQAVTHRLARMKLRLDSARLLVYRAANFLDEGHDDHAVAAMAKIAASEAIVAAAEDGLRLMAGLAWRTEPIDYTAALRDSLGGLSASGTTEIQLEIVARSIQAAHLA
jgi:alkylation response protein AidB-like acyl-CoA dehydrogenase